MMSTPVQGFAEGSFVGKEEVSFLGSDHFRILFVRK
jgi:hypothetical protein